MCDVKMILRRQTSRSHYGSKVLAVTVTVFKYRNKIGKIVVKAVPYSVTVGKRTNNGTESFHLHVNAQITVFTVFRLLTDFVCLYNYEFGLSLCKIVRSSVILLLPLFINLSKTI
jgi:hypothetical protein